MGISGRIAAFFLHTRMTPLLGLVALLLGLFAVGVTPREEEPQIDVTMANVMLTLPGADSADVERLVAGPFEQRLAQLQGLEHVYSVSRPGVAVFTVQFEVGVPRETALVRLHDTVSSSYDVFAPELGVSPALVKPKGIDDVPVLSLTLWADDAERGAYDLERVAHSVEAELKRVPGTRDVAVIGGPGRVLRVDLDVDRLAAAGMSPLEVQSALQAHNASLPAGSRVQNGQEVAVVTGDFFRSRQELETLVVGVREGRPIYLSEVAQIHDGPEQAQRYVWHGIGAASTQAGQSAAGQEFPAVTLTVTKKAGENAVDMAQALQQRVNSLVGTVIPDDVQVTVTRNYGETADDKAKKLIQKLIFATLSVVALVFFALGRREAVIVGGAVLLTLAATLFASWAWGFTLNRVSLFALIFSIGILVDDAIVVVENIHRHMQLYPNKRLADIIPAAVDEVGNPTILATFTVIAALLPMAFVSGLMGPYMSPIPINASMGMVLSLIIAFVITPWMGLHLLRHHGSGENAEVAGAEVEASPKLKRFFDRIMRPFLDEKTGRRSRHLLYLGVLVLIALSVSLAGVKLVVLKMLPFDNKSEFQVVLDMPEGTPLEETAAVLHEMAAHLAQVPEVTHYQAYAGTAAPINFNGLVRQYDLRADSQQGDLQINLVDKSQRKRQSHQIAASVIADLQAIAVQRGARVKVVEVPPGPPVMSPLVAEIYGPDEAGRRQVAQAVREVFEATPDIHAVDDSLTASAPQERLIIDRNKAALLGVAPQQIAATLRMALSGLDVSSLMSSDARVNIPVRLALPPHSRSDLQTALRLTVPAQDGRAIPLSELVQVQAEKRDAVYHHKDLMPVSYVYGDMAGQLDSPLYGMFAMRSAISDIALPQGGELGEYFISQPDDPYRQYAMKWDGEWQITYETFRDMGLAYAVGMILIYLLVVAEFGSYSVPLVIMAPIPLTIIGVMPGHALLGAHFTATSMIGMIALAGIIVRNSILLVDFIKLKVGEGIPLADAVVAAAVARTKPIVLTGVAAMLGAFFILDDPIFNGLAISLIFGILVSTMLTLVLIPLLYYALQKRQGQA